MTPAQWKKINDQVTDAMLAHTKPFVTPLSTETQTTIRLVGTGTYIQYKECRILLTCEHVARERPIHYRFHGSADVFEHTKPWTMDKHPIDAAFGLIGEPAWKACAHQVATVPYRRFAKAHAVIEQAELLFFRGYAGENARYGFGVHQTNGSGYCTQEKANSGDGHIFELFWEPEHTQFSSASSSDAQAEIKFEDARGLSGSLVWNTRYLEVSRQNRAWSPEDAVVTGLLRRWDEDTKTLLVWRIEHLRAWLETRPPVTGR
jgi:hypothetical protein